MKELEINGVLDFSDSGLTFEAFQSLFLTLCDDYGITFGGAFYELDENGERK